MKRFSCRCRYTSKRYKRCSNPTHLIDSQSCGRRAGDLNLSSQRTQRCPALHCPAPPRLCPFSPPKYGFIKTTYGIYESAGPKAMLLLCLGRPSRNGKQKMTKKRQQRTKRSADSGVGLGGWKGEGGAKRRQGCFESFANLFKSGPLLNCCCCCCCLCCCCCHLAACNSFAC